MAAKLKFKLNHTCHKPGCEGSSGEVIEVTAEQAQWLSDRNGGEVVDPDGKKAKPKKSAEGGQPTDSNASEPAGGGQ